MGWGASLDALKAEMAKCILLSANCHLKLTSDERGWYQGKAYSQDIPLEGIEPSTCGLEVRRSVH